MLFFALIFSACQDNHKLSNKSQSKDHEPRVHSNTYKKIIDSTKNLSIEIEERNSAVDTQNNTLLNSENE